MYQSGRQTAQDYAHLLESGVFSRATSRVRVVESGRLFLQGLRNGPFPAPESELPELDLVIPIGKARYYALTCGIQADRSCQSGMEQYPICGQLRGSVPA